MTFLRIDTMYIKPKSCPHCNETPETWNLKGLWCIKKGYYKTKYNAQKVPRYLCKRCKNTFCSRSSLPTYKQKKPHINKLVFKWYASGTTQRRIARNLGVNPKTIARKLLYLGRIARNTHEYRIKTGYFKTSHMQFDEMESYEHTLAKPVSIALAVDTDSGHIIDAQVSSIKSHGRLGDIARRKYGFREDTRDASREDVFKAMNQVSLPGAFIITDKNPAYAAFHRRFSLLSATLIQTKSKDKTDSESRRNKNDNLWRINHTSSKLRHDLSRLARRTWATTKRMWALQAHLDLYIAYNNGYELF